MQQHPMFVDGAAKTVITIATAALLLVAADAPAYAQPRPMSHSPALPHSSRPSRSPSRGRRHMSTSG